MKFLKRALLIGAILSLATSHAAYKPNTLTSLDLFSLQANNFTLTEAPNNNFISDVAYGYNALYGETWCAVADEGSGSTAASMVGDNMGLTWTAGTTPASTRLLGVGYNPIGRFVAVGVNGSNAILLSSTNPNSCAVWTSQTLPTPSTYSLRDAASNGTVTVAVGEITVGNSCKVIYSSNLTTWTAGTTGGSPCAGGLGGLYDVLWDGAKFVAVGPGKYATSTDGITWTSGAMPTSTQYTSLAYNGKIYVALDGSGQHSAVSSNGTTWTNYTTPGDGNSVTWTGKYFLAGALNIPDHNAMYSVDGIRWSPLKMYHRPSAIATDGYQVIAIGLNGVPNYNIMRSIRLGL